MSSSAPSAASNRTARLLVLAISSVLSVCLLELVVRLLFGAPVFTLSDLRTLRLSTVESAVYDPLLGWTLRSNISGVGFNTSKDGFRKNLPRDEPHLEGRPILAVGDSFTAGSDVNDEDTWPAQLERMLGQRVINAGIGGYGTDQIVLNADRLLPILKPTAVLLGFLVPDDVQRAGYSVYSRPKPYFIREGGQFVHKNNPVPDIRRALSNASIVKRAMSRFMTFQVLFEHLNPDWWFSELAGQGYERAGNNPSSVTCYLIGGLHDRLSADGIRGVVVLQYGASTYADGSSRSYEAEEVSQCAREIGYEIVDEYESLNAVARRSIDELKLHYVMRDNTTYGHMSRKGNGNIASLIAERLRTPAPPSRPRDSSGGAGLVIGDGVNLLTGSKANDMQTAEATVAPASEPGPVDGEPVVRIGATEEKSEHYVVTGWSSERPGVFTFSIYVRERPGMSLRLQIHDADGNAAIVDFAQSGELFDIYRIKRASEIDFVSEQVAEGWLRLSLSAALLAPRGSVFVQMRGADGSTVFDGGSSELVVQAPMVERGSKASRFCQPGRCPAPNQP